MEYLQKLLNRPKDQGVVAYHVLSIIMYNIVIDRQQQFHNGKPDLSSR